MHKTPNTPSATPTTALAPVDANTNTLSGGHDFADIVGGALDAPELQADTAAQEQPAQPYKRVLQPLADAPKLHKVLAQAGLGSRLEMEKLITDLEKKQADLALELELPATYDKPHEAMRLNRSLMDVQDLLTKPTERWEQALDALAAMDAES